MKLLYRNVLAVGAIIAISVLFIVLYSMFNSDNEISRAKVVSAQHQDFVIATGSVEANDDILLSFEDSGLVRSLRYESGDKVSAGSVIASLDSGTLTSEIEAQQLQLDQEIIKLNSFIEGPEANERASIDANIEVSKQKLTNEVRTAFVSAQSDAVNIENVFHTEVDLLFSGTSLDPKFEGNVSPVDKFRINKIRREAEDIFIFWRSWSNSSNVSYKDTKTILEQFEKDLRALYEGTLEIYDIIRPIRTINESNQNTFLTLSQIRKLFFDSIVSSISRLNSIENANAQHNLILTQSVETLNGSTNSDRLVQTAQVDVEREKLRSLELTLAKKQIRAPFDGVIGETFVSTGEFINKGSRAARFVSNEGFNLSVNVTEVEIQSISVGQEMKAVFEVSGEERMLRVRTIDPTERRINDVPVYSVVFDIVDDLSGLRSGLTADIYIPSGEPVDVFTLPLEAVVKEDSNEYVSVEREGEIILIPVTVGELLDDGIVVVSGELIEGETVVLNKKDK